MTICSDSQAALKALEAAKVTSNLVAEVIEAVNKVSICNSVRLLWIPGHCGIPGNETVDGLAKKAASTALSSWVYTPAPEGPVERVIVLKHATSHYDARTPLITYYHVSQPLHVGIHPSH